MAKLFLSFFTGIPGFIAAHWQNIALVVITAALAYGFHSCEMNKALAVKVAAVAEEKKRQENQCAAAKLFTTGVSNEYLQNLQGDNDRINDRYNSIIMRGNGQNTAFCIPITGTRGGMDATGTSGSPVAGSGGVPAIAILGIAKQGDLRLARKDRKLKACQKHAAEIERLAVSCQ